MVSTPWRITSLLVLLGAACEANSDPDEPSEDGSSLSPDGEAMDAAAPRPRDASLDARAPQQLDASPRDASSPADARAVDANSSWTFAVDSTAEWTASGVQVQAGRCYDVAAKIDDKWLDLDVPADLSGWIDKQDPRLVLFTPFRRVVQDDIGFYQFAACVDKQPTQCFPIGAMSNVCPKSAGELFFFINDAPGFETNNVGTATVTITAR